MYTFHMSIHGGAQVYTSQNDTKNVTYLSDLMEGKKHVYKEISKKKKPTNNLAFAFLFCFILEVISFNGMLSIAVFILRVGFEKLSSVV